MKPLEEMGRYSTVVVDPPWNIGGWFGEDRKPAQKPFSMYECMSLDQIKELKIDAVLEDDALVFLWTTMGYLRASFDVLDAWELRYFFTMTWVKTGYLVNKPPTRPFYNSEWIVVGAKGKPEFLETKAFHCANIWPAVGHSIKPEEFYDLLRRVTPAPRLDVFNRRVIPGFASWGNESPETDIRPGVYQDVMDI